MQHPLFSPVKNFYWYLSAWMLVTGIHAIVLLQLTDNAVILSLIDAVLFNFSFAAFSLASWYNVRYAKIENNKIRNVVLNHVTVIGTFLLIWISVGYFLMKLTGHGDLSYLDILDKSLPFRFFSGLLYYLVIIFFYYTYWYYLSSRENLVRAVELKNLYNVSQLQLLKSQLNPHFIFNSLNSINALTMIEPSKAGEMIVKLSSYLRNSLSSQEDFVAVVSELENVHLYLDIENMRFGDKLNFEEFISEDALTIKLPGMLLQPLIENAVKHGAYESLGQVKISLKILVENNFLKIRVANGYERAGNTSGRGIGLKNVKERLYLTYRNNYRFEIIDQGKYFEVLMELPVS